MQLKDFTALMNEYETAKKMYAIDCMRAFERIVKLYEYNKTAASDIIYAIKKEIQNTQASRLALESAQSDFKKCFETECETESFAG